MTKLPAETLRQNLERLDPEISKILWKNFSSVPVALSRPIQEAKGISRQGASIILSRLVEQGLIEEAGGQRPKTYLQPVLFSHAVTIPLEGLEEHIVWANEFRPVLEQFMSQEALGIWDYGFTEMLNNAVDHSQGTEVQICAKVRASCTSIWIQDNGQGIFKRIARLCKLIDERQAILELAKGKLTTDPENHTGEGVFFSSRAFENFQIRSGELLFDHRDGHEDFLFERDRQVPGTLVWMGHGNRTERKLKDVFDEFAMPDEYTFSKTVVPVRLARFGHEGLVSRSQAQRLLARVDRFKVVLFDFSEVETIGQAFADEIFRVYARSHPEVEIEPVFATPQVQQMIARATAHT